MLATGELESAFLLSARSLIIGLGMAIVTGTALGLLMGRYRTLAKQRERLSALAVRAIAQKKYVSAKRLCELAADREQEICDIRSGSVRYYRITRK